MSPVITPFAPELATPDELRAWYRIAVAAPILDLPGQPVVPYDSYAQQLCTPAANDRLFRRWDARDGGQILGTVSAILRTDENSELATVYARVAPQYRRKGVGTQLLRATLPEIREQGCQWIDSDVASGTDSAQWAGSLGFRAVLRRASHHLDVKNTDPALWQVPAAPGFRIQQWAEAAPDDLVQGFTQARNAMADQPIGWSNYQHPTWTVERVRQHEATDRRTGSSHRYVVAVEESSGAVAGFTEIAIPSGELSDFRQGDTAVRREFRGLGLGLAMKAAMMRRLTADHPGLERIRTMTAVENEHMIRVNSRLGYTTDGVTDSIEVKVDALDARLKELQPRR